MISNSDSGVSDLLTGQVEIDFYPDFTESYPGGTWLHTGPDVNELLGTGYVLPGWLNQPPDRGFVPTN